jgi:hypothetical protein
MLDAHDRGRVSEEREERIEERAGKRIKYI